MRIPDRLRLALLAGLVIGPAASPAAAADLAAPGAGLLTNHCLSCHDAESKKGGLDLTALRGNFADPAEFRTWVKVHDRVTAGEMPPRKELPAREKSAALAALATDLTTADRARQAAEGRATLRRLTRTEYQNTLRDLLDLPELEVKNLLPEDGLTNGLDKVGDGLELSTVQLARYMEVADLALSHAIARTPEPPEVFRERYRMPANSSAWGGAVFPLKNKKADRDLLNRMMDVFAKNRGKPLLDFILQESDSIGILAGPREAFIPAIHGFGPIHSGMYRLRLSLWAFHYDGSRVEVQPPRTPLSVCLVVRGTGRRLAYLDVPGLESTVHEVMCWLNAGDQIDVIPAEVWPNFSNWKHYVGPAIGFDYADVEGPIHETWPPASHKRLFGDLPFALVPKKSPYPPPRREQLFTYRPGNRPHVRKNLPTYSVASPQPLRDAERLLDDFLQRAFRRPVPPEEAARYVQVARDRLLAGDCFEEAMRAAYKVILCSPDFLFLRETPGKLDDYALASRLSYFLWGSMPDDALLISARRGELTKVGPRRHLDRMLKDPRSERFIADFLDQWLSLRDIDATTPDTRLYPEFHPDLRDAMLAESRAFFRELIDKDLSATNVVHSDFAMINQRLAQLYRIPGVTGSAIRRVPLEPHHHRGGFLTQAAVLKVTANGTVTSPVRRGAWILDRILGQPPAPPPPDVPAVDPDVRGTATIREQLDKHRTFAACAACHAKIDPPGFALESFDVIGGWRTKYRAAVDPEEERGDLPDPADFINAPNQDLRLARARYRYILPVDASGVTTDGREFQNIDEFKAILLRDPDAIARNLVSYLAVYATGAPISFADRAEVDRILARTKGKRHGVRSLIGELIASPLFVHK